MPKNPSNSGHRGYKMSIVQALDSDGDAVKVTLSCGHTQRWYPSLDRTVEVYRASLLEGINPFVLGKTKIRCNDCAHKGQQSAPLEQQKEAILSQIISVLLVCPDCGGRCDHEERGSFVIRENDSQVRCSECLRIFAVPSFSSMVPTNARTSPSRTGEADEHFYETDHHWEDQRALHRDDTQLY